MKKIKLGKKSYVVMDMNEYKDTQDLIYDMAVNLHRDKIENVGRLGVIESDDWEYNQELQTFDRLREVLRKHKAYVEKYPEI